MPTPRGLKQKKNLACNECGKLCAPMGLNNHIRLKHKTKIVNRELDYIVIDVGILNNKFPFPQIVPIRKVLPKLKELSEEEHRRLHELYTNKVLTDLSGNILEFLGGNEDDDGYLRRLVFLNRTRCLVELWDIDEYGEVNEYLYFEQAKN